MEWRCYVPPIRNYSVDEEGRRGKVSFAKGNDTIPGEPRRHLMGFLGMDRLAFAVQLMGFEAIRRFLCRTQKRK